jgi:hypothetical protein
MMIFHSYVSLPEGNVYVDMGQSIPWHPGEHRNSWDLWFLSSPSQHGYLEVQFQRSLYPNKIVIGYSGLYK